MNSMTFAGETKLADYETFMQPNMGAKEKQAAALNEMAAALDDPEIASVSLHKPGSQVKHRGKLMRVDKRGCWRKVSSAKLKAKRKMQRTSRRANR